MEPESFSFSQKRALCYTSTQEEMRYEGSQVKAPPITRRRMTPPTPLQYSYTLFEREQEVTQRKAEEGTQEKEQLSQE